MLSSLKESFRQLALVKQYLLRKSPYYKIVAWPGTAQNYILHDFIKRHDHRLKSDNQLLEALIMLLNVAQDPLHKGKRN